MDLVNNYHDGAHSPNNKFNGNVGLNNNKISFPASSEINGVRLTKDEKNALLINVVAEAITSCDSQDKILDKCIEELTIISTIVSAKGDRKTAEDGLFSLAIGDKNLKKNDKHIENILSLFTNTGSSTEQNINRTAAKYTKVIQDLFFKTLEDLKLQENDMMTGSNVKDLFNIKYDKWAKDYNESVAKKNIDKLLQEADKCSHGSLEKPLKFFSFASGYTENINVQYTGNKLHITLAKKDGSVLPFSELGFSVTKSSVEFNEHNIELRLPDSSTINFSYQKNDPNNKHINFSNDKANDKDINFPSGDFEKEKLEGFSGSNLKLSGKKSNESNTIFDRKLFSRKESPNNSHVSSFEPIQIDSYHPDLNLSGKSDNKLVESDQFDRKLFKQENSGLFYSYEMNGQVPMYTVTDANGKKYLLDDGDFLNIKGTIIKFNAKKPEIISSNNLQRIDKTNNYIYYPNGRNNKPINAKVISFEDDDFKTGVIFDDYMFITKNNGFDQLIMIDKNGVAQIDVVKNNEFFMKSPNENGFFITEENTVIMRLNKKIYTATLGSNSFKEASEYIQDAKKLYCIHKDASITIEDWDRENMLYFFGSGEPKKFPSDEIKQGRVGDCFLLTFCHNLCRTSEGRKLLGNLLKRNEKGDYVFTLDPKNKALVDALANSDPIGENGNFRYIFGPITKDIKGNQTIEIIISESFVNNEIMTNPNAVNAPLGIKIIERMMAAIIKKTNGNFYNDEEYLQDNDSLISAFENKEYINYYNLVEIINRKNNKEVIPTFIVADINYKIGHMIIPDFKEHDLQLELGDFVLKLENSKSQLEKDLNNINKEIIAVAKSNTKEKVLLNNKKNKLEKEIQEIATKLKTCAELESLIPINNDNLLLNLPKIKDMLLFKENQLLHLFNYRLLPCFFKVAFRKVNIKSVIMFKTTVSQLDYLYTVYLDIYALGDTFPDKKFYNSCVSIEEYNCDKIDDFLDKVRLYQVDECNNKQELLLRNNSILADDKTSLTNIEGEKIFTNFTKQIGDHAISIKIKESNDGKKIIEFTNPWNTEKLIEMDYGTFCSVFNNQNFDLSVNLEVWND